ncbi:Ribonuclease H2 subunit B [Varanus komodoensis]|nr:Ribonuclease H2 subunit B [Varanus komodoensis]
MSGGKQQRLRPTASAEKSGSSQWVIVAPGQAALYLFSSDAHQLFEVKAFCEEYRSWFIGQTVQSDGRLFFAIPVDPLYFALFFLLKAEKEQGKFQPLDQILMDEEFPSCAMLLQCPSLSQSIRHIAEEKEIGCRKFYKYSEEKTLKWLKKKVDQMVKVLKDRNQRVGGRVQAATFISGKPITDATEEVYIRYAHGLISEYILEEPSIALAKYLRLPEIASPPAEPASKKRKLSSAPVEAEEDYTKFNTSDLKSKKANSKMSAAQKALTKVDKSGMKAISSFFTTKTKATE